jgi:hypothetical protein
VVEFDGSGAFAPSFAAPPGFAGKWGWQLDFRLAKPFPIVAQQFAATNTPRSNIPTAPTAHGWEGWQLDSRLAKPFPVVEQLYSASLTPVGSVPTAKTAHGWESWQLNSQLAKSFPVAAQQFLSSFTLRSSIATAATPHGWEGWQLNIRFAKPFPIHDQQFVSWPAEFIPSAPPPPGSGRRYLPPTDYLLTVPPAWNEKTRKPIKPIWDRGGKVEEPKQPASPRKPPPAPLSIFGPGPQQPLDTSTLPKFGQYSIDRPLSLADRLMKARVQTAWDDDEEAIVLILDSIDQGDDDEEE